MTAWEMGEKRVVVIGQSVADAVDAEAGHHEQHDDQASPLGACGDRKDTGSVHLIDAALRLIDVVSDDRYLADGLMAGPAMSQRRSSHFWGGPPAS